MNQRAICITIDIILAVGILVSLFMGLLSFSATLQHSSTDKLFVMGIVFLSVCGILLLSWIIIVIYRKYKYAPIYDNI